MTGAAASLGASTLAAASQTMNTATRQTFDSFTLSFNDRSLTSLVPVTYPTVMLLDTIKFQQPYDLVGFDLNASFFSLEGTLAGFFLFLGQNSPTTSVSSNANVLASAIIPLMAADFVEQIPSQGIFFDDETAIRVPAGMSISLYGANTAAALTRIQAMAAIANLFLIPTP